MNATDLREVAENIRDTSHALRAYMRFADEVLSIAVDMAERGDSTSLRLLNAMRDLHAQTGEFVEPAVERDSPNDWPEVAA